jgi:hypothetical protein
VGYNNNYAPVTLGPDGAAYVGVLGGLVRLADSSEKAPTRVRPKLRLNARRFRDRRLRLSLGGPDRRHVRNVEYQAGKRRLGRATRSPFRVIVRTRARRIKALVTMSDGRGLTVRSHRIHRP